MIYSLLGLDSAELHQCLRSSRVLGARRWYWQTSGRIAIHKLCPSCLDESSVSCLCRVSRSLCDRRAGLADIKSGRHGSVVSLVWKRCPKWTPNSLVKRQKAYYVLGSVNSTANCSAHAWQIHVISRQVQPFDTWETLLPKFVYLCNQSTLW